jgi:hypothetical protein
MVLGNRFWNLEESFPPIPALAVVALDFSKLLSGAGYTGKRYGKKADSLCGEDFKVRASD